MSLDQLMDIEVTSVSKRPEKLSGVASAIQVVTADDIRRAGATSLPPLILMTDEKRLPDPVRAALALPKGAAIILRHTNPKTRARLACELAPIAKARELRLLIANRAVDFASGR